MPIHWANFAYGQFLLWVFFAYEQLLPMGKICPWVKSAHGLFLILVYSNIQIYKHSNI